jgi:adenylate cyclase class 2
MKEFEVKILEVNHLELEPKILSLGAKKVFEDIMDAYFFDNDKRDIRNNKETLRIRVEGKRVVLTHKKRIESPDVKIREENEAEIKDLESARNLLESLGFKCFDQVRKKRISYKVGSTKFEFDIHEGNHSYIPEFLEIESTSAEEIYKYAQLLGFSKEDCGNWSISDLVKKYSKSPESSPSGQPE